MLQDWLLQFDIAQIQDWVAEDFYINYHDILWTLKIPAVIHLFNFMFVSIKTYHLFWKMFIFCCYQGLI